MRSLYTLILVLLATALQAQNYAEAIDADVANMKKALESKDYNTLVDYTYPAVIEQMGGKEAMVKVIESGFTQLESQGVHFRSVEFGAAGKVYKAGDQLHALVPQKIVLAVQGGSVTASSHLLAISQDNGNHWSFLDTSQLDKEAIKGLLPNYNDELVIPARTEPVFSPE